MIDAIARIHLDSNGTDLTIEHVQDVEDILDWNAQARTQEQHSDWGRHVARIPNAVYVKWWDELYRAGHTELRIFSHEFDQIVRKKLQDPEWAHLRVDRPALQCGWSFDK